MSDDDIRDAVRDAGLDWHRGFAGDDETNRYAVLCRAVERAARAAAFREAADAALKVWPAAHTYSSENADLYMAQDAVRDRIVAALRARAEGQSNG